ncbi:hypothetical protein F2Q70_00001324 [Brassica cretica]|uniref:Uncharacterized protein n=1 Tax=Brassica cretica TaxID=69181 RepID=A0A8S9IUI3_BRACR|nr:hypothetical protein F2Q70_00001324 [Brassica cretica]
MPNLRFLRVYKGKDDGNDVVHIPGEMEFPRRLRLLHWEAYPSKYLPHTIHLEYLVELNLQNSKLEKLWEGSQMEFPRRLRLLHWEAYPSKYLPHTIHLEYLVELNLQNSKLEKLWEGSQPLANLKKMDLLASGNLKELPDLSKATKLEKLNLSFCTEKPSSYFDQHSKTIYISEIEVEDERASIKSCSRLKNLTIRKECIKDLNRLQYLNLCGCRRLSSLPELPGSLVFLYAEDCESLETVFFPVNTSYVHLFCTNCFKLGEQARKAIIRQTATHGREVPAEFDHRDSGNSLTINRLLSSDTSFQVCLVVSPKRQIKEYRGSILCSLVIDGLDPIDQRDDVRIQQPIPRILCGVQEIYDSELDQIFEDGYYSDTSGGSNESEPKEVFEDQVSKDDDDGSSLRSNPAKRLKTR